MKFMAFVEARYISEIKSLTPATEHGTRCKAYAFRIDCRRPQRRAIMEDSDALETFAAECRESSSSVHIGERWFIGG